jgi:mannose-6-phosphate isomerase-like protein (cupin superfamily)
VLDSQAHEPGTREHLTLVSGSMELQVADAIQRLKAGETARYPADCTHTIRNPGKSAASAWLVVMHPV